MSDAPSKVIAVGNPIKIHRSGGVILPGAAAPFDIAIEWIDQRRCAVKDQRPIPPQLNLPVFPSVEIGGVPGIGYRRANVHQGSIRVNIVPKFVTAIDERNSGRGRLTRGVGGQA